jgi:hypothetical protein
MSAEASTHAGYPRGDPALGACILNACAENRQVQKEKAGKNSPLGRQGN